MDPFQNEVFIDGEPFISGQANPPFWFWWLFPPPRPPRPPGPWHPGFPWHPPGPWYPGPPRPPRPPRPW